MVMPQRPAETTETGFAARCINHGPLSIAGFGAPGCATCESLELDDLNRRIDALPDVPPGVTPDGARLHGGIRAIIAALAFTESLPVRGTAPLPISSGMPAWTCPRCSRHFDRKPYAFLVCERCRIQQRNSLNVARDALAAVARLVEDLEAEAKRIAPWCESCRQSGHTREHHRVSVGVADAAPVVDRSFRGRK